MSGLTLIYGTNPDPRKLVEMAGRMAHRGRGQPRSFLAGGKIFLHTVLSTEGVANDDASPTILNERGTAAIAFAGRLYNHRQLAKKMGLAPAAGLLSDARLVLRLYDELGIGCVPLLDGSFAFAIADRDQGLLIARDPLGLTPLYFSEQHGEVVVASEMKALSGVVETFSEFPSGNSYQPGFGMRPSFELPEGGDPILTQDEAIQAILDKLRDAVRKRIVPDQPLGVFLSGGLDSSIIAALTAEVNRGVDTFAVGMAGSQDLEHARLCAQHLGTRHHEYVYDLDEMISLLPTVIRQLESFDAALVRSSVPNFILARQAGPFVRVAFTGEGADELFAGYLYMAAMTPEELRQETLDVLMQLHNTNLQRGDRMATAHGVEPHVPFLDLDFIRMALRIPVSMMIGPEGQEKWILRQAVANMLPPEIVIRKKQKFSHGAGSFLALAELAEKTISDREFAQESVTAGGHRLLNKEELMYYRVFREIYPQPDVERAIDFSKSL